MDRLKEIIDMNRDMFESEDLPEGFDERFQKRLSEAYIKKESDQRRRNRIRLSVSAVASIAAGLLLYFGVIFFSDVYRQRELDSLYKSFASEIELLKGEMIDIAGENNYIDRTLEIITSDAIPLDQLLPNEISQQKRVEILKEYYNQKLQAVKQMKLLMSYSEIEE